MTRLRNSQTPAIIAVLCLSAALTAGPASAGPDEDRLAAGVAYRECMTTEMRRAGGAVGAAFAAASRVCGPIRAAFVQQSKADFMPEPDAVAAAIDAALRAAYGG